MPTSGSAVPGRRVAPPPLVIFDCDGVLVDSEPLAARVNVDLLTALGWPVTLEEVQDRFIGCSAAYFRAEVQAHIGPMPADWDARFKQRYEALAERELTEVTGVGAVAAALAAEEVACCVASNSSAERVAWNLERTGLLRWFDGAIFSAREVGEGKPAPDVFLHAAAKMGVEPTEAVVIEDSRAGVEAALRAGMAVFGYVGGLTKRSALAGSATEVFDDMAELPGLLGLGAPSH